MTKIIVKTPLATATRQQSDERLIEAVAGGDTVAMQALYQRHCSFVKRFLLRLTDNVSIVDDIVSETFLDVWRRADTFEGRSQVATWLLSIARHKLFSMLRRGSALPLDEEVVQTIQDPSDDPEIAMGKLYRDALLHKCVAQLPPAHRQVINLVYLQGKSVGEVADLIGIPASTVKTRMFYARNRIGEQLSKEGVDRGSL